MVGYNLVYTPGYIGRPVHHLVYTLLYTPGYTTLVYTPATCVSVLFGVCSDEALGSRTEVYHG